MRVELGFRLGAILSALLLPVLPARALELESRTVDLRLGPAVSSIAARQGGGFAVGFDNCRIGLLNAAADLEGQWPLPGCKLLFTVRTGVLNGTEAVVGSTYVGRAAVITGGTLTEHKAHKAAATDSFLIPGGLLVASDDGSVRTVSLAPGAAPSTLMTGVGVARVLLLDPVMTSGQPRFYAAFDSGMIQESPGGRRFNAGIGRVNSLVLSADRRTIYVGGFDGRVRAINVATNQVHDVLVTGGSVNAVALNAAGSRLVAVNDEGRLILVEPRTGQATGDVKLSASALTAVALSHDGRTALAGDAKGLLYQVNIRE